MKLTLRTSNIAEISMSLFLRSRRSYATFFTTIACLSVPAGWADHKSNTIAELRAQLEALTARLSLLKPSNNKLKWL